MKTANFNENLLPKINNILKFVLENPYSDFYRNKYEDKIPNPVKSYEDFQKIPILEKDEFLIVDAEKRIFVPTESVKYYSFSSGTTGKKISVVPHSSLMYGEVDKYRFNEKEFEMRGVSRIMTLFSYLSPPFIKTTTAARTHMVVIPGDINNLKLMAKIAKETKIDGIVATPTVLEFFIDHLAEENFDLSRIKWVSMGSEFCSAQKAIYLGSKLPNAFFRIYYGISEICSGGGYRCNHISNEPPNIFHPEPLAITEVIRGTEHPDESGYLIHTDLQPKAFPLIRYNTKDVGSIIKRDCSCGNDHIVSLNGKAGFDILKFSGITLSAQAIENSLDEIRQSMEPRFQMHVFEEMTESNKLKPRLKLHIKLKPQYKGKQKDPYFVKTLRETINNKLRLSPKSTLKQLTDQKVFLPLEIIFVENWPAGGGKQKNIISHFE